jgi:excisionase family DNA binding protein
VTVEIVTAEEFAELRERLAELERRLAEATAQTEPSPYMTIVEAAEYLRCSRQRVDDLLSQRRLTRQKDGRRTLVRRSEVEAYLQER